MGEVELLEDRQRVDRWLEEGQYMLGRIIPNLVEDRERLMEKLEAAERECGRLHGEVNELRRELMALQSHVRAEQAAIDDAFGNVMNLFRELQKPFGEIQRRVLTLHSVPTADATI